MPVAPETRKLPLNPEGLNQHLQILPLNLARNVPLNLGSNKIWHAILIVNFNTYLLFWKLAVGRGNYLLIQRVVRLGAWKLPLNRTWNLTS